MVSNSFNDARSFGNLLLKSIYSVIGAESVLNGIIES